MFNLFSTKILTPAEAEKIAEKNNLKAAKQRLREKQYEAYEVLDACKASFKRYRGQPHRVGISGVWHLTDEDFAKTLKPYTDLGWKYEVVEETAPFSHYSKIIVFTY